jgi:hypothetical protein
MRQTAGEGGLLTDPKERSPARCKPLQGFDISVGGRGRNRTADTGIFNPLLYQLSYPAMLSAAALRRAKDAH